MKREVFQWVTSNCEIHYEPKRFFRRDASRGSQDVSGLPFVLGATTCTVPKSNCVRPCKRSPKIGILDV